MVGAGADVEVVVGAGGAEDTEVVVGGGATIEEEVVVITGTTTLVVVGITGATDVLLDEGLIMMVVGAGWSTVVGLTDCPARQLTVTVSVTIAVSMTNSVMIARFERGWAIEMAAPVAARKSEAFILNVLVKLLVDTFWVSDNQNQLG